MTHAKRQVLRGGKPITHCIAPLAPSKQGLQSRCRFFICPENPHQASTCLLPLLVPVTQSPLSPSSPPSFLFLSHALLTHAAWAEQRHVGTFVLRGTNHSADTKKKRRRARLQPGYSKVCEIYLSVSIQSILCLPHCVSNPASGWAETSCGLAWPERNSQTVESITIESQPSCLGTTCLSEPLALATE